MGAQNPRESRVFPHIFGVCISNGLPLGKVVPVIRLEEKREKRKRRIYGECGA
jgi:hypothetical protein